MLDIWGFNIFLSNKMEKVNEMWTLSYIKYNYFIIYCKYDVHCVERIVGFIIIGETEQ